MSNDLVVIAGRLAQHRQYLATGPGGGNANNIHVIVTQLSGDLLLDRYEAFLHRLLRIAVGAQVAAGTDLQRLNIDQRSLGCCRAAVDAEDVLPASTHFRNPARQERHLISKVTERQQLAERAFCGCEHVFPAFRDLQAAFPRKRSGTKGLEVRCLLGHRNSAIGQQLPDVVHHYFVCGRAADHQQMPLRDAAAAKQANSLLGHIVAQGVNYVGDAASILVQRMRTVAFAMHAAPLGQRHDRTLSGQLGAFFDCEIHSAKLLLEELNSACSTFVASNVVQHSAVLVQGVSHK